MKPPFNKFTRLIHIPFLVKIKLHKSKTLSNKLLLKQTPKEESNELTKENSQCIIKIGRLFFTNTKITTYIVYNCTDILKHLIISTILKTP